MAQKHSGLQEGSRRRHSRRYEGGFADSEPLLLIAAIAIYAAVAVPMASRLFSRVPWAPLFVLIPPTLCYLWGFVQAMSDKKKFPESEETFLQQSLGLGNAGFIALSMVSLVIGLLYAAVRGLMKLL